MKIFLLLVLSGGALGTLSAMETAKTPPPSPTKYGKMYYSSAELKKAPLSEEQIDSAIAALAFDKRNKLSEAEYNEFKALSEKRGKSREEILRLLLLAQKNNSGTYS